MKTTNEVLEGLSTIVLDDIISSYTQAFTPPPPPYVSTTVSVYFEAHIQVISSQP